MRGLRKISQTERYHFCRKVHRISQLVNFIYVSHNPVKVIQCVSIVFLLLLGDGHSREYIGPILHMGDAMQQCRDLIIAIFGYLFFSRNLAYELNIPKNTPKLKDISIFYWLFSKLLFQLVFKNKRNCLQLAHTIIKNHY